MDDDETEDEYNGLVEMEMRIPRKRQITFGPPHSTSYSRWFSHFNGLDNHYWKDFSLNFIMDGGEYMVQGRFGIE